MTAQLLDKRGVVIVDALQILDNDEWPDLIRYNGDEYRLRTAAGPAPGHVGFYMIDRAAPVKGVNA